MSRARFCFMDNCREVATLVLHSYPDDVLLCDDHRNGHIPDEYLPEEPCAGDACWCSEAES